jgi:hypothetical protein
MDHCKCGRDLGLMRKIQLNLRQHLIRCEKSDQVSIFEVSVRGYLNE